MTERSTKIFTETDKDQNTSLEHQLILINDDEHSFDYVIEALVDICQHTTEQAIQCTMITHYKGRCDIKRGPLKLLRPMRKALVEKELKSIIC